MGITVEVGKLFTVRAGTRDDEPFVADAWLRTFRDSSWQYKRIPEERFRRLVLPLIQLTLLRSQVRIVSPRFSPETILGFAVLEADTIHMVFVRRSSRRMGIARLLLKDVDIDSCAWSTPSQALTAWIQKRWPMKEYRPFWLIERSMYVTSRNGEVERAGLNP